MQSRDSQEKQFKESFEMFSDDLFRHSFFRVSNREVALDLVQDTFMKTWNHIVQGNEIDNIRAFLYRVLNNLIIDYYRKSKASSLDNLIDEGFDPHDDSHGKAIFEAEISLVKRYLSNLTQKDQDVVLMRYMDGLSVSEIAKSLGETENAVSVRVHRAVQKLKEFMEP